MENVLIEFKMKRNVFNKNKTKCLFLIIFIVKVVLISVKDLFCPFWSHWPGQVWPKNQRSSTIGYGALRSVLLVCSIAGWESIGFDFVGSDLRKTHTWNFESRS
jgi:hypothetical protein